ISPPPGKTSRRAASLRLALPASVRRSTVLPPSAPPRPHGRSLLLRPRRPERSPTAHYPASQAQQPTGPVRHPPALASQSSRRNVPRACHRSEPRALATRHVIALRCAPSATRIWTISTNSTILTR